MQNIFIKHEKTRKGGLQIKIRKYLVSENI